MPITMKPGKEDVGILSTEVREGANKPNIGCPRSQRRYDSQQPDGSLHRVDSPPTMLHSPIDRTECAIQKAPESTSTVYVIF